MCVVFIITLFASYFKHYDHLNTNIPTLLVVMVKRLRHPSRSREGWRFMSHNMTGWWAASYMKLNTSNGTDCLPDWCLSIRIGIRKYWCWNIKHIWYYLLVLYLYERHVESEIIQFLIFTFPLHFPSMNHNS